MLYIVVLLIHILFYGETTFKFVNMHFNERLKELFLTKLLHLQAPFTESWPDWKSFKVSVSKIILLLKNWTELREVLICFFYRQSLMSLMQKNMQNHKALCTLPGPGSAWQEGTLFWQTDWQLFKPFSYSKLYFYIELHWQLII